MGWKSLDEYVHYMVSHVGLRATAAALKTDANTLLSSYPDLDVPERRGIDLTHDHSCSAAAIRKRRERNKPKFRENPTLRCESCGCVVVRTSANQRFCHRCGKERKVRMSVEYNRELRAKRKAIRADSSPDAGETE